MTRIYRFDIALRSSLADPDGRIETPTFGTYERHCVISESDVEALRRLREIRPESEWRLVRLETIDDGIDRDVVTSC